MNTNTLPARLFIILAMFLLGCEKEESLPATRITDFYPAEGVRGTTVIIHGENFNPDPTLIKIEFNGMPATVDAVTESSITTTVPAGATPGKISITSNGKSFTSTSSFKVLPSVFVAGAEHRAGGVNIAKMWENGVVTNLSDGTVSAFATSIYISGTDVYCNVRKDVGAFSELNLEVFKNGFPIDVSAGLGNSDIVDCYISGPHVYVAGNSRGPDVGFSSSVYSVARTWKNGVGTILSGNSEDSQGFKLYVEENNVYLAGMVGNKLVVWRNGEQSMVTSGEYYSFPYSLYVSNGIVYIAGIEENSSHISVAKLWKNNSAIALTDGTKNAAASSVFVHNGDVYVVGYEYSSADLSKAESIARIWKNGSVIPLAVSTKSSEARDIYVFGGDVYVVGYEIGDSGSPVAKLWKNGVSLPLEDAENSYGRSVFVGY